MLRQRLITAAVLIPLVLLGLFFLPLLWFAWLTAALFLLAAWEWCGLIGIDRPWLRGVYLLVLLLVCWLLGGGHILTPSTVFILAAVTWLLLTFWVCRYALFKRIWSWLWLRMVLGIWLLALAWYGINFIRWQDNGAWLILILFLWVWGADTGAFFVGKRWGRHKLAPEISPGKTREGVLGGLVVVLIIAIVVSMWLPITLQTAFGLVILSVVITMIAVIGDLFESMVKRQKGVKDSGHLLPGHGGILDRIDSLISTLPIYAGGLLLLERLS